MIITNTSLIEDYFWTFVLFIKIMKEKYTIIKPCKLLSVSHGLTGKMAGMPAITSSMLCNEYCERLRSISGTVCEKCYTLKYLQSRPSVEKCYEDNTKWTYEGINGITNFLNKVWDIKNIVKGNDISEEHIYEINVLIKKVTEDIEAMKFNTAIASMMELINTIYSIGSINKAELKTLVSLLNPFAPHITEELNEVCNLGGPIYKQSWPTFDESKCVDDSVEIVLQINGKIKDKLVIAVDEDKDSVLAKAKANDKILEATEGKQIVKEIYIPGKLVNIVVK